MAAKPSSAAKGSSAEAGDKWFEKPLGLLTAVGGILVGGFSAGYVVGNVKTDLEQQVVSVRREQECNERVAQEKEKCSEFRRSVETEKMESLVKTVESLKAARSK